MAGVVLDNLSKDFAGPRGERIRALSGATLCIRDRELLVLVGPSGCGKTTTLRLIAGLEKPSSGSVRINDRIMSDVPPKDRDVAMVFQQYALYPHMTVYENLAFGLKLRKLPADEIKRRVHEVSGMLELTGLLERRPEMLSGGQCQRVALGRALARRPGVLLLDEPLSGLDARLRGQMRLDIARLQRNLGLTLVYVTHDQVEAMSLADRIAVMCEGTIRQVGSPKEIYETPNHRFVAEFFGSPPNNFFAGTIAGNRDVCCFLENAGNGTALAKRGDAAGSCGPFRLELPGSIETRLQLYRGKEVILSVRPENIELASQTAPARIEGVIHRIERLGPDTHVHLDSASHSFTVRARNTNGLSPGQQIVLGIDLAQARFFDPQTGKAIE